MVVVLVAWFRRLCFWGSIRGREAPEEGPGRPRGGARSAGVSLGDLRLQTDRSLAETCPIKHEAEVMRAQAQGVGREGKAVAS